MNSIQQSFLFSCVVAFFIFFSYGGLRAQSFMIPQMEIKDERLDSIVNGCCAPYSCRNIHFLYVSRFDNALYYNLRFTVGCNADNNEVLGVIFKAGLLKGVIPSVNGSIYLVGNCPEELFKKTGSLFTFCPGNDGVIDDGEKEFFLVYDGISYYVWNGESYHRYSSSGLLSGGSMVVKDNNGDEILVTSYEIHGGITKRFCTYKNQRALLLPEVSLSGRGSKIEKGDYYYVVYNTEDRRFHYHYAPRTLTSKSRDSVSHKRLKEAVIGSIRDSNESGVLIVPVKLLL